MTTKVLVDSDAVIALIKKDDKSHLRAKRILKKYSQMEPLIADTTIAEVVTALGRKVSRQSSLLCLDYLRVSNFNHVYSDAKIMTLAEEFYRKQTSNKNTLFDCINMAVTKTYRLDAVFSFDQGYEKNGFKLLK